MAVVMSCTRNISSDTGGCFMLMYIPWMQKHMLSGIIALVTDTSTTRSCKHNLVKYIAFLIDK